MDSSDRKDPLVDNGCATELSSTARWTHQRFGEGGRTARPSISSYGCERVHLPTTAKRDYRPSPFRIQPTLPNRRRFLTRPDTYGPRPLPPVPLPETHSQTTLPVSPSHVCSIQRPNRGIRNITRVIRNVDDAMQKERSNVRRRKFERAVRPTGRQSRGDGKRESQITSQPVENTAHKE